MYAKVHGSGERHFMCFHGWGGDHREFTPLSRYATSGVCMHCVDLPGYGHSAKPANWDLETITQEALAYLDERNISSASMVGFCSGIGPALTMAKMVPGYVERIVMIDPFAFVPWYFKLFISGGFGRRAYATTFQTSIGRKITDFFLKRLQKSDADFTSSFLDLDHNVTLKYLQMLHQVDLEKEYRGLETDVLILYGQHTFKAVRDSVRIYQNLLPRVTSQELNDVGHLPMVKGARQLAEVIFTEEKATREFAT
jgi:pimeloyl-ACP methyl ester carboxylesterase